jgi:hypothetical protein
MMPAMPAPRVRFTSPSGLPSFARAAGAMKIGEVEGRPRRVVEVSHWAISMKTLGRNRTFRSAFVFSACAGKSKHASLREREYREIHSSSSAAEE